jgi:hypothetical protein
VFIVITVSGGVVVVVVVATTTTSFSRRLTLAATTIKTTATAQATAAAGDAKTKQHQTLEPLAIRQQIRLKVLLAHLLGQLQAHTAVLIVDLSLGLIAQHRIGLIDVLEFGFGLGVARILVGMIF